MGEPNGSKSTIEPLSFFVENLFKNLQTSSSDVSKFFKPFNEDDFEQSSIALGLASLQMIFSEYFISFATLNPLEPIPAKPSRNIFGPSKFFQNAEYAIIE